jgi:hypothetical protein
MDLIDTASNYVCDAATAAVNNRVSSIESYLFPCPADKILNVRTDREDISLVVSDELGREVLSGRSMESNAELNTTSIPNGVYVLRITSAAGLRISRFVVKH